MSTEILFYEDIPSNIYKPKDPLLTTILKNKRLTADDSPNDVRHIQLDISGSSYRYMDGQSIGVLPEGVDADGKPHKLRLYSISSPSRGDDGEGKTVSICVKRLDYTDEKGNRVLGVCSNYLSDLPLGSTVRITGPVGKTFLLPPAEDANLIMVATGTGIAPFRAFLHTRYHERLHETGQVHLFFGVQSRKDFLYHDEVAELEKYDTFHMHTAFSREERTEEGERMYVQHRLFEQRDTILNLLLDSKTYFYVCGLRGMEVGILEAMRHAAEECNVDWDVLYETLKAEKRWHIEVY
jgi:ferredoxin--NADP+ reductase